MTIDLESVGISGASGFVTAVLTLLGWNRRLSQLEKTQVGIKACELKHSSVDAVANEIREELKYIRVRVDKLIDIQLNGKGRI